MDAAWDAVVSRAVGLPTRTGLLMRAARDTQRHAATLLELSERALRDKRDGVQQRAMRGDMRATDWRWAAAIAGEYARRTLGMTPYPVQLAAVSGIERGWLVEMATGEGKSLVAALASVLAGWRGRGCHVLTVNDYLAKRDADHARPLLEACGLTVRHIEQEMQPRDRAHAYSADVTYCTNKEVAADFLRDRLAMGRRRGLTDALLERVRRPGHQHRLVMRGLETAIVDEADSILIDEAVTPLILSAEDDSAEQIDAFAKATDAAQHLTEGAHYRVQHRYRDLHLTAAGRRRIAELTADFGELFQSARLREEYLSQALSAKHLFHRDQHYILDDGKVVIVDESTGRLMPDRTWRAGLHQAVEAKEGLQITAPKMTLARVSFQRFFRCYRRLSGMTGTGWEVRHELWRTYRLRTARVPTHRPCIRKQQSWRLLPEQPGKLDAVIEQVKRAHQRGQPVLVGTRSVAASEALSQRLAALGLEHRLLNATHHAEEAQIVAGAGQRGHITVATNMAGRGTDIVLGEGEAELGGLRVIATECNAARRIDRQLFGRAARQGDPGVAVGFASLDDEVLRRHAPRRARLCRALARTAALPAPLGAMLVSAAQAAANRAERAQRRQVMQHDDQLDEILGFTGREL